MIAFVDSPPTIEPHGEGFRVTLKSGDSETAFMLTLHALTAFAERGRLRVKEAQAKAALFQLEALEFRQEWPPKKARGRKAKNKD